MAEQRVQYEIEIKRTGDGALLAATELKAVGQAAQQAGVPMAASTGRFVELKHATEATRKSMAAMRDVTVLVGLQAFPQLSGAIFTGTSAMSALRSVAVATGASMSVVSIAAVGLAAGVWTAVESFRALHAVQAETKSRMMLDEEAGDNALRLAATIGKLREETKLTADEADRLVRILNRGGYENIRTVQMALRGLVGTGVGDKALADNRTLLNTANLELLSGADRDLLALDQKFQSNNKAFFAARAAARPTTSGTAQTAFDQESISQSITLFAAYQTQQQRIYDAENQHALERDAQIEAEKEALSSEIQQQLQQITQRVEAERQANEQIKTFKDQLVLDSLTGEARELEAIEQKYQRELKLLDDLSAASKITAAEQMRMSQQLDAMRTNEINKVKQLNLDIQTNKQIGEDAAKLFASGFSQAFMDFVSGTKSAGEAFKEFAAAFLREVARMIIQTLILRAISSIFGAAGGGGGGAASISAGTDAQGGIHFAADGIPGIANISAPTFFPRFNVLAGEAGSEMMTVMARPHRLSIGGIDAVVGNVGPNKVAMTSASDLAAAGGAAGGNLNINVSFSPGVIADITENSVQRARVAVAQDVRDNTTMSRNIRQLVS